MRAVKRKITDMTVDELKDVIHEAIAEDMHGDPDLPEEHAGGGPRRGVKSEHKFGMKMIGLVGVSLMISY